MENVFVDYKQLSINERINLRSGFDAAISYEKQGKTCRIKNVLICTK